MGVQQIVLRNGYFRFIFVGLEMAQLVKAQVLYARSLGSEFESHR